MPNASIARSRADVRAARFAAYGLGAVLLAACGRFPRDNPYDTRGTGDLTLERSDDALIVNDDVGGGPFNNENGIVEPNETVFLTVPVDARRVSTSATANVTVESLSEGDCVISVIEQSAAGTQLLSVSLPTTSDGEAATVLVGPIELVLDDAQACDVDVPLDFLLLFRIVERDQEIEVPFSVSLSAPSGELSLDEVVVDDAPAGDGALDLDPGETVVLFPALTNEGDTVLRALELSTVDDEMGCIAAARIRGSSTGRLRYGDLLPRETGTVNAGTLEVTIDPECASGDPVSLRFEVRDASDQRFTLDWVSEIAAGGGTDAGVDGGG